MARDTVSAVIPNKNSERTLARTLDSLTFCDEVIIVEHVLHGPIKANRCRVS